MIVLRTVFLKIVLVCDAVIPIVIYSYHCVTTRLHFDAFSFITSFDVLK